VSKPVDDLLAHLVEIADTYGDRVVHDAYTKFKNPKKRAKAEGKDETKRQAIPKHWSVEAWDRQNGYCVWCGEPIQLIPAPADKADGLSGDHREPISTGGAHAPENIDAMHRRCNSSKGNRGIGKTMKRARMSLYHQELIRAGMYEG
jgi:5-methylcytosine-specific restriction endonuclease McrA